MSQQSVAQAIPFHTNGMRVGLLGGSFNPPHAAHRAISLFAIKRLKLDRVWWWLGRAEFWGSVQADTCRCMEITLMVFVLAWMR